MEYGWQEMHRHTEAEQQQLDALFQEELCKNDDKIVVLDDDPTGTQTVHDVSVYTDWEPASIRCAFAEPERLFYILTNNRARTPADAVRICREIGKTVAAVAKEQNRGYMMICRGDSTLRGHYPLETQALQEVLAKEGTEIDGEILCPFFLEGGRFTQKGMHYVQQDGIFIPAQDTEFAKDRTFGYRSSYLPRYIEEKTAKACRAEQVLQIPRELLCENRLDEVEALLCSCTLYRRICVDACEYGDLTAFAIALYRALAKGKRFLFQSAASLVKTLSGIRSRALLRRDEMLPASAGGGIVIVGSHTQKTTRQLERLLTQEGMVPVPFRSAAALESTQALEHEVTRCVALQEEILSQGATAVCYTERTIVSGENLSKEEALLRAVRIGEGVRDLVAHLSAAPAFIIAKGGITSSDIATKALGIHHARVLGQIVPGVSVWRTPPESRFPGIPYVVFPGNVGDEDALRQAAAVLTAEN